ncbi:hypothetical protein EDC01DRAFT_728303 [Geopyxis carbonaria]|nr:hypothetical protein EDC01DRAFT_728303 [Geopyxis carbonaria]
MAASEFIVPAALPATPVSRSRSLQTPHPRRRRRRSSLASMGTFFNSPRRESLAAPFEASDDTAPTAGSIITAAATTPAAARPRISITMLLRAYSNINEVLHTLRRLRAALPPLPPPIRSPPPHSCHTATCSAGTRCATCPACPLVHAGAGSSAAAACPAGPHVQPSHPALLRFINGAVRELERERAALWNPDAAGLAAWSSDRWRDEWQWVLARRWEISRDLGWQDAEVNRLLFVLGHRLEVLHEDRERFELWDRGERRGRWRRWGGAGVIGGGGVLSGGAYSSFAHIAVLRRGHGTFDWRGIGGGGGSVGELVVDLVWLALVWFGFSGWGHRPSPVCMWTQDLMTRSVLRLYA